MNDKEELQKLLKGYDKDIQKLYNEILGIEKNIVHKVRRKDERNTIKNLIKEYVEG